MGRWRWAIVAMALGFAALMWFVATGGGGRPSGEPRAVEREVEATESTTFAATTGEASEGISIPEAPPASEVGHSVETERDAAWPEGIEVMTVSGRVLHRDGTPASDAEVLLLPDARTARALGLVDGGYRLHDIAPEQLASAHTDASGRFELEGPWMPDGGSRPFHSRPVFPSVLVRAEGAALHAFTCLGFAGGRFDIGDLALEIESASIVARFVDADGVGVAGVVMRSMGGRRDAGHQHPAVPPVSANFCLRRVSGPDGSFALTHLWPGTVQVRFASEGHDGTVFSDVELRAGATADLGTIVLSPDSAPRLTGRVVDTQGAPIEGARVVVEGTGSWQRKANDAAHADVVGNFARIDPRRGVLTDAAGRYELTGLPRYWAKTVLAASAPGYEPALHLGVPFDTEAPELRLHRAASLAVRVLSAAEGRPISEARVLACRLTGQWEHERPRGVLVFTGGGVVRPLGPLGTQLLVDAPGHQQRLVKDTVHQPGVSRDLVVELEPSAPLVLQLVDERGEPAAGVSVDLDPPESWASGFEDVAAGDRELLVSDERGRLELRALAPGRWWLSVADRGFERIRRRPLEIAAGGSEHQVELRRAASVEGVVTRRDGSPASGLLVSASTVAPGGSWGHGAHADVDGHYFITGLPPGTVSLWAESVPARELTLEPGEARELDLQQAAPFTLEGKVRAGGEPVAGAQVGVRGPLLDGYLRSDINARATTDEHGRYVLEFAAVGDVVFGASHGGALPVERVVRAMPGARGREDVELGAAFLGGVVDFGAFDPAQADEVFLILQRDGEFAHYWRAEPDGSFRFGPLPAGRYTVVLEGGDWHEQRLGPFELAHGERRDDLSLTLAPSANLRGSITFENGQVFSGGVHLRDREGRDDYFLARCFGGTYETEGLPPGTWQLDLSTRWQKHLGAGADGIEGTGEPGAELPFFAREVVTLEPGETRELDIMIPGGPP